jgi:hypothetical protein
MMFNNGLPDSSLFCFILFLCLLHCLSAHITCAIYSSAFYALCTMSVHCTVPLLCSSAATLSSSSHMNHLHQQHSQQPPTTTATMPFSSLYYVFIASMHLVHAMFSMPLHADFASLSSTSRVFCLIIIMTLQLLW